MKSTNNNEWFTMDKEPPDEFLEIMDENGNKAFAYPTVYPFKVGKKGNIIHCEPYWDGGWLIECNGLDSNIESRIIKWRKLC